MTNIAAAAYIITNAVIGICSLSATTGELGRIGARLGNYRSAYVVEREMTCPDCHSVSTQRVDITDVYDRYKRMQASDMRIKGSLVELAVRENTARMNELSALRSEVERLRATSALEVRKVGKGMYVDGYTNALMKVVNALRKPEKTCLLCRRYSCRDEKLMRSLADAFESVVHRMGEQNGTDNRN